MNAQPVSGGNEYYGYAPDNKRIVRLRADGVLEVSLYGIFGEKLWVYQGQMEVDGNGNAQAALTSEYGNVWFGKTLIYENGQQNFGDRVGTNRNAGTGAWDGLGGRFLPYGEELTGTSNDRVKFGTYTRDSISGWDYADQRYYVSGLGRFSSVDRFLGSAGPRVPLSWNRYAYVLGDPINASDRTGNHLDCDDDSCSEADCYGDPISCMMAQTITVSAVADPVPYVSASGDYVPGDTISYGEVQVNQSFVNGMITGTGGANQLIGAFASTSAGVGMLAGSATFLAGGYLASTLTSLGLGEIGVGSTVYRAFGGSSGGSGLSWTPVDPSTLANFGNAAGLPPVTAGLGGIISGNTGQFVATGVINDMTGVIVRPALPIPPNSGGLTEVLLQSPCQVTVICVGGVNPPLVRPH